MSLEVREDDDIQMWEVHQYNNATGEVTIINHESEERRIVSVEYVLENQM